MIGEVAIGQGAYPWMLSTKKVLFKGTKNSPAKPADPFAFIDPRYLTRLKMIGGAAAGAALAPDVLEPLVGIREVPPFNGHPAIRVTLKGRNEGTFLVLLKEDRKSPHGLTFDLPGVKGTVKFHGWETNTVAHDAMFAPPPGCTEKCGRTRGTPADLLRHVQFCDGESPMNRMRRVALALVAAGLIADQCLGLGGNARESSCSGTRSGRPWLALPARE